MNILYIFSHPWGHGGAETHVASLIRHMRGKGHYVVMVYGEGGNNEPVELCDEAYTIPFRSANPVRHLLAVSLLFKLIKDRNIDIVHAHQRTAGYYAALIEKVHKIPSVVTVHDGWHRSPLKSLHGRMFSRFIAVSKSIQKMLIEEFSVPEGSVHLIYNGIDLNGFAPSEVVAQRAARLRVSWGLSLNECAIVTVGRITRAKGCWDIPKVLAQLKELPIKWILVGEGNETEFLEEAKTAGVIDKIVLAGYQQDMAAVYSAADIVVHSSKREAFGLAVVEAMAAGKAVAASSVGGILEIIDNEKNGVLFATGDIQAITTSIKRLIYEQKLRTDIEYAAIQKAQIFTLSVMTAKTEQLYNEMKYNSCHYK